MAAGSKEELPRWSKDIADRLSKMIEGGGLTPETAADLVGLGTHAVYRWLRGETAPAPLHLALIIRNCEGGSLDHLFGIDSKLAAENRALRQALAKVHAASAADVIAAGEQAAEQLGVRTTGPADKRPRGR